MKKKSMAKCVAAGALVVGASLVAPSPASAAIPPLGCRTGEAQLVFCVGQNGAGVAASMGNPSTTHTMGFYPSIRVELVWYADGSPNAAVLWASPWKSSLRPRETPTSPFLHNNWRAGTYCSRFVVSNGYWRDQLCYHT